MNPVNDPIRILRGTRVAKGDRADPDRYFERPSPRIPKCSAPSATRRSDCASDACSIGDDAIETNEMRQLGPGIAQHQFLLLLIGFETDEQCGV